MMLHGRKLLQYEDAPRTTGSREFLLSPTTANTPISRTPASGMSTSMVLTLLVIVSAFFTMGFLFSVYFRRIYNEVSFEISARRRRRSRASSSSSPSSSTPSSRLYGAAAGVDPSIVKSLPLFIYNEKGDESLDDCAVCLTVYEERETVKLIPHCGHVFHPECIDKWLSCHGSCPLCRSTQLLSRDGFSDMKKKSECLCSVVEEEKPTVENGGTSESSSAAAFGDAVLLKRSSSLSLDTAIDAENDSRVVETDV